VGGGGRGETRERKGREGGEGGWRDLLVLGKLPLDHEGFNIVDGMDIVHAVDDDLAC